eukprot:TRINITY_DN27479_c0_g1_i1.p1 TRINITY_DN27479_c0_g1~~TRINITY_DN27479_c0_g1_i1.p1  ORF type:complete len:366 (+),score=40.75 TRINITY_DN27479_c0_g1_i1:264-1361(+)
MPGFKPLMANGLLFVLVYGMSSTVSLEQMKAQIGYPLIAGLICQFGVLPMCGTATASLFDLSPEAAVPLVLVCCSPGGSFSNLWCGIGNADMALSIAMTAVSTACAMLCLPLNLWLWLSVVLRVDGAHIDVGELAFSLLLVVMAVALGLATNKYYPQVVNVLNRVGTSSGLLLILLSGFLASDKKKPGDDPGAGLEPGPDGVHQQAVEEFPRNLFLVCALPFMFGLLFTVAISTFCLRLERPQRVALAIETCYQNTGIALAFMVGNSTSRIGLSVPLICASWQVAIIIVWLMIAWKANWTFAPPDDPICKVIVNSYQREEDRIKHRVSSGSFSRTPIIELRSPPDTSFEEDLKTTEPPGTPPAAP